MPQVAAYLSMTAILFLVNIYDFNKYLTFESLWDRNAVITQGKSDAVMDGWLIGSILNARDRGLLSSSLFTARYILKDGEEKGKLGRSLMYQAETFEKGGDLNRAGYWHVYKSAIRLPIQMYVVLDSVATYWTGKKVVNVQWFKILDTILISAVLAGILTWLYYELGTFVASVASLYFCFATLVNSTLPGYSDWLPYALLLFGLNYFRRYVFGHSLSWKRAYILGAVPLLILCTANSYDYVIIAFGMGIIPLAFYAPRLSLLDFRRLATMVFSCCALVSLVVLVIHFLLAVEYTNSFDAALEWFSRKFVQRTYGEGILLGLVETHKATAGQSASLWSVITRFTLTQWGLVGSLHILILSLIFCAITKQLLLVESDKRVITGLIFSICASYASTLTYFIIFKSQAADHNFGFRYWEFSFYPFAIIAASFCLKALFFRFYRSGNVSEV